jgi:hypothetical protein
MRWLESQILSVLEQCCENFTFPMLDNGYVYPAASRLGLYRSAEDWAITIEVFGFSPRSGIPDIHIYTFGSRLLRSRGEDDFVSPAAHSAYLTNNPNNESVFVYPIDEGDWQDLDDSDLLADAGHTVSVRGKSLPIPSRREYAEQGIALQDESRVYVFELCRLLAASNRESVLASQAERRVSIPPQLEQILLLDDWHHPDLAGGEAMGNSATFESLANALAAGDASKYRPTMPPNTHWRHWPEAGTL